MARDPRPRPQAFAAAPSPTLHLAALAVVLVAACSDESRTSNAPQAAPRPPDIVLITVDTLRADHLSQYGYGRPTGSALGPLLEDAVLFRDTYSTSSWTSPALASLMTSRHPYQHGVRTGIAPLFLMGLEHVFVQTPLDATVETLAEQLSAAGYRTVGFSANPHTTAELGFDQGFDHFEYVRPETADPAKGIVYADAADLRRRVEALHARLEPSEAPRFLWVHAMDPHLPYRARQPWLDAYRPQDVPRLDRVLPHFDGLGLEEAPVATRRGALVAHYDAEIHFAARELGEMLSVWGVNDEALLVFTADHGESFFEHDRLGHAVSLYDPELRVPLLVRFPRSMRLSGAVSARVSLVDVMPTVLEIAGVPAPPGAAGLSLVPLARGDEKALAAAGERILKAELRRRGQSLHAALRDPWKLILDERSGTAELYDTRRDPLEQHDHSADEPEIRASLEAALQPQRGHLDVTSGVEVTPEVRSFLQALGYVEPDE